MKIIVLTTVYNCAPWLEKCISSIKSQTYTNFECYLLNDMSTDNSAEIAIKATKGDRRFNLINNTKKYYQAGNYDQIMRSEKVNNADIVVEVDGDDWLPDNDVFTRVVSYYKDPAVWMTYGQFIYQNGYLGLSAPVNFNELRSARFTASHLRTWKPQLWNHIKVEDLLVNNDYAECSGDVFFMFPMLEMSGPEHAKFIPHINYIYNFENPIGDSKGERLKKTEHFAKIGREKLRYERLNNL